MVQTIKEIKNMLSVLTEIHSPVFDQFLHDERTGVQKLIVQRKKQLQAIQDEKTRLDQMLVFERMCYQNGLDFVAGVDEVGRGPLAGPVVAAAVILPKNCEIIGLNDSKKVPKQKHVALYQEIKKKALAIGIGRVEHTVIDEINIYEATKVAMLQALEHLSIVPQHVLIDAMVLEMPIAQTKIIHGDAKSCSIAAASIVAKVTRDELMRAYDEKYPGYDFAQNAGYGTAKHLSALTELGISPIHRLSYEPIKSMRHN